MGTGMNTTTTPRAQPERWAWRAVARGVCALGAVWLAGHGAAWAQSVATVGGGDAAEGLSVGGDSPDAGAPNGQWARPLDWRWNASFTVSDNISAQPSAQGRDAGAMLRVGPGVRWVRQGGGAEWLLDYSLQAQRYARTAALGKPFQSNLRSSAKIDLGSPAFTFEGQASIAQRTRSAFEAQRTLGESVVGEATEVGSLALGPTARLRLGEGWRLTARQTSTLTRARGTAVGDARGSQSQVSIEPGPQRRMGLGATVNHQFTRPLEGRRTATSQATMSLTWRPDVDWTVVARGGQERSNLQSVAPQTGTTYGLDATWQPTPRTRLQLNGDHRVVGNFHTVNLEHRFSRAVVRLSDSRSVNQAGVVGAASSQTNYDLFFAQLATTEPDPVQRDLLVRQRLADLGLSGDALAANGFLSSQPTASRTRLLGVTYQQPRTLWTLNLTKTRTSRLFAGGLGSEDLASSSFVDTESAQMSWTYRLTPVHALRAQASWQRNEGENAALQRNRLRTVLLGWAQRAAPGVQVALALRHSAFESPTRPFAENAVVVNVEQRF
jgi:uncharacterized protein (PEP-CTERM system associated)